MNTRKLRISLFFVIILVYVVHLSESSPAKPRTYDKESSPVVYRRYVRKRPSTYASDAYMEEVHEIFETKYKPPQFSAFDDDEIDQVIRCDFEPHLRECERFRKKEENISPVPPPLPPSRQTPTTTRRTTTSNTIPTTRPTTTLTSTTRTRTTEINLLPIPTRPVLRPYKPTPAIDPRPPQIHDESNDIPTLPPESEEYTEPDQDLKDPLDDQYDGEALSEDDYADAEDPAEEDEGEEDENENEVENGDSNGYGDEADKENGDDY